MKIKILTIVTACFFAGGALAHGDEKAKPAAKDDKPAAAAKKDTEAGKAKAKAGHDADHGKKH